MLWVGCRNGTLTKWEGSQEKTRDHGHETALQVREVARLWMTPDSMGKELLGYLAGGNMVEAPKVFWSMQHARKQEKQLTNKEVSSLSVVNGSQGRLSSCTGIHTLAK